MDRLLKSRVGAARVAMRGIEDPAARAIVSNAQAAAIAELAGQVVQQMSAEARASLVAIASETPWAPGDFAKVLEALTKTGVEEQPKWKRPPTQVSAIVIASSSNQQLPAAISSHQLQIVAASIHQQQPATSNQRST